MEPINWPQIITTLVQAAKLTQPEIARLCQCGQSTISDLLRGNTTDPRTSTGLLLLGLAKQHGIAAPEWPRPGVRACIDVAAPPAAAAQPTAPEASHAG